MRYSDRRSDSYNSIQPAINYFKKVKQESTKFSRKYYRELFNMLFIAIIIVSFWVMWMTTDEY